MADEKLLNQARAVYNTLCQMLDGNGWHYDRDDQKFTISCSARGDDLSMEINIEIDAERRLVLLFSPMPFVVGEDRRIPLAVATSVVNYKLVDGSFDYNIENGKILFRMTSSYRDSLIGKDLLEYMLFVSCRTIDDYNDKFLAIAKNDMSTEEIIKFLK